MYRSFTDRVLAGVCGGLAQALHAPAWLIRLLFIVLTVMSIGLFALPYVILWWITAQESFVTRRRAALSLPLVFLLLALTVVLWAGRDLGWLEPTEGQSLYLPVVAVVLAFVYFLRQVRA